MQTTQSTSDSLTLSRSARPLVQRLEGLTNHNQKYTQCRVLSSLESSLGARDYRCRSENCLP